MDVCSHELTDFLMGVLLLNRDKKVQQLTIIMERVCFAYNDSHISLEKRKFHRLNRCNANWKARARRKSSQKRAAKGSCNLYSNYTHVNVINVMLCESQCHIGAKLDEKSC